MCIIRNIRCKRPAQQHAEDIPCIYQSALLRLWKTGKVSKHESKFNFDKTGMATHFFMYNFFVLFCKNLPLLWSDPVGTRQLRGQSPYACCVPLSQCLSSSNVSELDPGVHELGNCLARFLHACRSWVSFAFNTPLAHSCVLAGFASWKLQWCQIVERSKLHFSNVHCTSFHQNSQCIHL